MNSTACALAALLLGLSGCSGGLLGAGRSAPPPPEPTVRVAIPDDEEAALRRDTEAALESAERRMAELPPDSQSDSAQQLRREAVHSMLAGARAALAEGDLRRAAVLSAKAGSLAEALAAE